MDQNLPVTPSFSANPVTPSFTSIKKMLQLSWERVQKHLLQLFLLTVLMFAFWIVVAIVIAGIFFAAGAFSAGGSSTVFGILGLIFIPLVIIFLLITILGLQIATIMLLAESQPALSLIGLYKTALKKILPLTIVSFITTFLVLGGLIVFIIPGILFGVLLSLSTYFLLLDNLSPLESIKRSVYVVSKNFGAIFVRMAALTGISILASMIFNLLSSQGSGVSILTTFVSMVFNLLFGWVSIAYMMFTFQDAKKAAGEGKGKMLWMVIVALIGWLIIGVGGFFIFRAAGNASTTTIPNLAPPTPLTLPSLSATPTASIRPASASASVKPTATPRSTATARATATPKPATSSANR